MSWGISRAVATIASKRSKDRHRAERNIFQDLEFLLKAELRHEDGAADQKQREDQQDIENF